MEEELFNNLGELDAASEIFMMNNPFASIGVFEGDHFRQGRGRLEKLEEKLRNDGVTIRNNIRDVLHVRGFTRRRKQKSYQRDRHNRVSEV